MDLRGSMQTGASACPLKNAESNITRELLRRKAKTEEGKEGKEEGGDKRGSERRGERARPGRTRKGKERGSKAAEGSGNSF